MAVAVPIVSVIAAGILAAGVGLVLARWLGWFE